MSYTALYRKFRPQEFKDVKGQDAIVTTLKNQIKADRIGHAYLFCGTRGTGKTTVAKIFAKAVNCESPADGSPCGKCASCRAVAAGVSMNVIEIDAASNNGVDSIREIREEVSYRPTEGMYKVYIIDEVHMLSSGAFNALLKTLEEPPSYVIFILATTEVHKIPVTIVSRCQRYDFRRISVDIISERLKELLEQEGVCAEEKALRCIAKAAGGAMRDALSLLDQCIAFYLGESLTYDRVLEVLGAADAEVFADLFGFVAGQDVAKAVAMVERLLTDGRELGQFTVDFTWYLRNLLFVRTSDETAELLDVSSEQMQRMQDQAEHVDAETLIRYIRIFSELCGRMKYASQKRILLEIALIKLCRPQTEGDLGSLLDRIRQLEEKLEQGALPVRKEDVKEAQTKKQKEEKHPQQIPKAVPDEVRETVKSWKNIISAMPGLSRSYLAKAGLTAGSGNELTLVFEDEMAAGYFGREEERRQLERTIAEQTGREISVVIKENDTNRPFQDAYVDLEQVIHMEIEYE